MALLIRIPRFSLSLSFLTGKRFNGTCPKSPTGVCISGGQNVQSGNETALTYSRMYIGKIYILDFLYVLSVLLVPVVVSIDASHESFEVIFTIYQ